MRLYLAKGDATAAGRVYATLRARLAEDLRVKPSAETLTLADQIRASAAASRGSTPARLAAVEGGPPGELVAPLVGRAAAFRQLVGSFQQARGGQAQVVLLVGEAGIGKTRLATEFVAWARAQGAQVLSGQAFELGGRLPYQPLVEALRERLEAENAPEDLLEDLWLTELARLLPELRVRYPDLPVPTQDELSAKVRLFEAVARLFEALARRAPLVLLLEDLQWVDQASLDLLRYLGHAWREHGNRVLLLGTVRREGLELNPQLADLGRDLPLSQIRLAPLSQPETLHLLQALVGQGAPGTPPDESEPGPAQPSRPLARLEREGAQASELAYHALSAGEVAAAYRSSVQAGVEAAAVFAVEEAIGHYEQARALLQEHKPLQSELSASEVERLYAHLGRSYANQNAWEKAQQAYEELLAYAQRRRQFTLASMSLNRLAILAVQQANDKPQVQVLLEDAWRMAETSADQQALAETEWNRAQIIGVVWDDPTSGLPHGEQALSLARASNDRELEARSLSCLGWIHIRGGDFQQGMDCLEAALELYVALGNEQSASRELSLPSFAMGAPLTQPLTNRASEALCWVLLALTQVHAGQVQDSLRSSRRALALSQEIKNVWAQITSSLSLTYGLLEAGAYEEALALMPSTMAQARTLPLTFIYQRFLLAQGRTYHALQQWEEAHSTLEEAEAMAETLDLGQFRVPVLSQLCMHFALTGEWAQAYRYAVQAIALRESFDRTMILFDFSPQYETEALLRGGDESQARAAVS